MFAALALAALLMEATFGYPDALYRRIGHPVTWIGALITWCERIGNRAHYSFVQRRLAGVATAILLPAVSLVSGLVLMFATYSVLGDLFALLGGAVLASSLFAQRSLYAHVSAVATALEADGLDSGRRAVSMIVGRDSNALNEAGVSRAAIESLAENFSDGVVAPLFWMVVAGLPGALTYKAINTADSMIGHKSERYLAFGWAVARLDDLVNLPASRLAALWLILAAMVLPRASGRDACRAVWRDAGRHRSPNAGWPEAAMAGALGLRLAGPRVYGGVTVEDHWMGHGRADATAADIRRALRLYRMACAIQAGAVAGLAVGVSV